jgi:hypothetical protein
VGNGKWNMEYGKYIPVECVGGFCVCWLFIWLRSDGMIGMLSCRDCGNRKSKIGNTDQEMENGKWKMENDP